MNITFVCTGNTCRSPMAEGIFKKIAEERNINNVQCRSCGISACSGDYPAANAVEAVKRYGVNIENHRSSVLTQYLMYETDLFVCMTDNHAQVLERYMYFPDKRIIVLGGGIPDPYGGDIDVYSECAKVIYDELQCLADVLFCEISPMKKEDVDGIYSLEKECFSAPWSPESITEELANDNAHFLSAVSCGNVIGYIGVHEIAGEAYIANIAVTEKCRGYGLGWRLLEAAESGAKERGCAFISLEVRKSNVKAISLYKKRGFETVGERKNFYTNPTEDGVIMTLYFN